MNARDSILSRIPASPAPPSAPLPYSGRRAHSDPTELWTRFVAALQANGGQMLTASDLSNLPAPILMEPDARMVLSEFAAEQTADPWSAQAAITLADIAVAESGTIVLAAGPNRTRLASLTCAFHVVLLPTSRLVATLEDAVARMSPRSSVWITGPSRTADIEGELVRGVHGPCQLGVYRTDP